MTTQAHKTDDDETIASAPSPLPPAEEPGPGMSVGRYLIIGELGRGGMGQVLRAYDPKLQREIALKLLRTDVLDAESRTRLVREARAMAQLNHPNVVAVYDVETHPIGGVAMAMEYVRGQDLRAWLRAKRRPWREVLKLFVDAGRGLSCAHRAGLLHRDFKPSNVLLGEDGRARVTDFGLARLADPSGPSHGLSDEHDLDPPAVEAIEAIEVTADGVVVGTPPYMSPEQHANGELTHATDQYALCVSLWEALVGRRPFRRNGKNRWDGKFKGPPAWPPETGVPKRVTEVIRRGLAVSPQDRFASVDALLEALTRDPSRQRRRLALGGAVVLAAATAWGANRWDEARQHGECERAASVIESTWNADVARSVRDRLAASGVAYAVDTWSRATISLDRWASAWRTATQDVCTQDSIEHSIDARTAAASTACLNEQRARLKRFLVQLEQPRPSAIARITGAVARIPAPTICTNAEWLARRPEDPAEQPLRAAVLDTKLRLTHAGSLAAAGDYAAAISLAVQARSEAEALGWLPLRAAAAYQLGVANLDDSRLPEAREQLAEAFYLATEAGHDELALRAATNLVFVVGYSLAQPEASERWRRLAESLVRRLDVEDHPLGATLRMHTGVLLAQRGEFGDALADYGAALAIWEREVGEDHPQVVSVLARIGAAHSAHGDHADALQAFARGLEIRQRVYGPAHPVVADAWHNLGAAQYESGDHDDALASLRHALTIEREALPAKHPDIAGTLNNIANVLSEREQYDEALALFDEALAIKVETYGPDHREVGLALSNLAVVYGYAGDTPAAVKACDDALRILEASQIPPGAMAKTDAAMANVLWDAEQHGRAVELARRARRTLRTVAGSAAEGQLSRVEAWLANHRAPGQGIERPEG